MKPKLPIGLQNLREMRTQGHVYVDKTAHVARLVEEGKYYFLARPRRFGKSLLVDTLAEPFAGSRELFEGLYLESRWNLFEFKVVEVDAAGGALQQLQDKGYAEKYRGGGGAIYLIGVEFSRQQRNLVGFAWEREQP